MSVLVEFHNTGDAAIRSEVQAIVEHVLSDRPGEWRVSIVGSRGKEDWEMKVEGPNGLGAIVHAGRRCGRAPTCGHRESAAEAVALKEVVAQEPLKNLQVTYHKVSEGAGFLLAADGTFTAIASSLSQDCSACELPEYCRGGHPFGLNPSPSDQCDPARFHCSR